MWFRPQLKNWNRRSSISEKNPVWQRGTAIPNNIPVQFDSDLVIL